ncbi:MAG: formimidoylglutamate deiminase [Rhizomicrobium sp.]
MPLWFQAALLPQGWTHGVRLHVADGVIAKLERDVDQGSDDERHGVAIPGMCNVHSHGFQRGMAGLAEVRGPEGDNFWTWREVMYRFLDRLDPEQVEAITALAYTEMLERGFTRVGEFHYLHHTPTGAPYDNPGELAERIAAAASKTGIGLTLLPVFYAHSNFGGAAPTPGQRRFINTIDQFAALVEASCVAAAGLPGANVGIAPHSLRATTPDEMKAIVRLADDVPIHIHAAEQTKEVDDCVTWSGARPVEWLLEHMDVDSRWCLVHATHLTEGETRSLAESEAVVGLCPITEANLGDGIFPARSYFQRAGHIGIGTDSNVQIDAAGELRALEYAQRLNTRSRNVLAEAEGHSTGRQLFDHALVGGAQALGQPGAGIREGSVADVVSLDADDPVYYGRTGDAVLDSWVFAGGKIDCVWRAGQKVVERGRHIAGKEITSRYRRMIESVLE